LDIDLVNGYKRVPFPPASIMPLIFNHSLVVNAFLFECLTRPTTSGTTVHATEIHFNLIKLYSLMYYCATSIR